MRRTAPPARLLNGAVALIALLLTCVPAASARSLPRRSPVTTTVGRHYAHHNPATLRRAALQRAALRRTVAVAVQKRCASMVPAIRTDGGARWRRSSSAKDPGRDAAVSSDTAAIETYLAALPSVGLDATGTLASGPPRSLDECSSAPWAPRGPPSIFL